MENKINLILKYISAKEWYDEECFHMGLLLNDEDYFTKEEQEIVKEDYSSAMKEHAVALMNIRKELNIL